MKQQKLYILSESMMNQLDESILALQNLFCDIYSNHEIDVEVARREREIIEAGGYYDYEIKQ